MRTRSSHSRGALERVGQPFGHHAQILQAPGIRGAESRHGGPAPHAQVAHPARAVLQVGLQQEDGGAEPAVAFLLLLAQSGHEVLGGGGGDRSAVVGQEPLRQAPASPIRKRASSKRRGRRQIAGRQRQRLFVGPHRVSGVHLGVPQGRQQARASSTTWGPGSSAHRHNRSRSENGASSRRPKPAGGQDGHLFAAGGQQRPGQVADDRVDLVRQRARQRNAVYIPP